MVKYIEWLLRKLQYIKVKLHNPVDTKNLSGLNPIDFFAEIIV